MRSNEPDGSLISVYAHVLSLRFGQSRGCFAKMELIKVFCIKGLWTLFYIVIESETYVIETYVIETYVIDLRYRPTL